MIRIWLVKCHLLLDAVLALEDHRFHIDCYGFIKYLIKFLMNSLLQVMKCCLAANVWDKDIGDGGAP